jgi:glutamyl-tRNA synthetase
MAEAAIKDLRWLGLDWNEGPDIGGAYAPYVQSKRLRVYLDALQRLRAADLVYPCTCRRADIARLASAPHGEAEGTPVRCACAARNSNSTQGLDISFSWRFRTQCGSVSWNDEFAGPVAIDPSQAGGDFIVARSTGEFAYQLAVVVDDGAMEITQVVRGDDLLGSTPRQLLLYQAIGLTPPRFAHIPLVVDPSGRRLAKRDGSIKLTSLREAGVSSRTLVGLLAQSLGMCDSIVESQPRDWLGRFCFSLPPRTPWTFDSRQLPTNGRLNR